MTITKHLRRLAELILPSPCVLCGQIGDELVCGPCHSQFFHTHERRCRQCALPMIGSDTDQRCGECVKNPPAFDHTIVACNYTAPLDQMVLALKFGHRLPIAKVFSEALLHSVLGMQQIPLPELLTIVPLGQLRLRERGFNQAAEIAKPLAKRLGIHLDLHLLHRHRETAQQSSLHPDERHQNMRNAFTLAPHALECVRGKHIAVIDDVMTTGTTLNEIAKLLKRFGAVKVTNYVFARTLPH